MPKKPLERPLLFGKWKSDEVLDFSKQREHGSGKRPHYIYKFPDGYVDCDLGANECCIRGNFDIYGLDLEGRYQDHFKQMYLDGKSYSKETLSLLSKFHNELKTASVDNISWFGRIVQISLDIDLEKTGIALDEVEKRDETIRKVYEDIERQLRDTHGFSDSWLGKGSVLGFPSGQEKRLYSPKGLHVITSKDEGIVSAGTIYMKIVGDETAQIYDHREVLNSVLETIGSHTEKLRDIRGLPYDCELGENGTYWEIDFQRIPFFKKIENVNEASQLKLPHIYQLHG